jgi:bifunctional oligoribonuclease and PAP phosphatase NrnA
MQPLAHVNELLKTPKSIVITTHQNPDADALGSSLGLAQFLLNRGHKVTVISSTSFPPFLNWMQNSANIIIYERDKVAVQKNLKESDMLWCLDFNIISRTKSLANELNDYKGIKVIIDHHLQPDIAYFNYGTSIPEKSSTCEMVYDYIIESNGFEEITKEMGECLYAGCMTDTGSFRFSGTSAETHRMIGSLLDKGVIPGDVHAKIFDTAPERRLRLLGHILTNRLKFYPELRVALIALEAADTTQFSIEQGDTEGMVNYPLSVQNIDMAVFIHDKEGEVRMSFRSKGTIDVNVFARTYFEGGGHKNAAGGISRITLRETILKFEAAIQEYFKK